MMKINYQKIANEQRVIFISDIHGDLDLFKKLLLKIDYTDEDVLFINGDLCERGPHSLGVVRYVLNLQEQSKKVYVTIGNSDILIKHVLDGNERILDYLNRRPNSILHNMLEEHGKTHANFTNIDDLANFYCSNYTNEIDWLLNLPTAYETEKYIIVHAGIENIEDWQQTSFINAITIDKFYDQGHQAEKTVIVGHWPAPNYRSHLSSSNNPLIDFDKKIICIDGGNRVKLDGQINALILQDGKFTNAYVDQFQLKKTVQQSYVAENDFVGTVIYPHYEMKSIKREEFFTLCENVSLEIKQWIKNEYIEEREDGIYCKDDVSTTKISVTVGEELAIIDDQCAGYVMVKKAGMTGWVPEKCFKPREVD